MTSRARRPKPSLSPRYRLLINATGLILWASGVGWLAFHYFVRVEGEFGPTQSPAEPWWLKVHGAAAFLTLFTVGLLWGVHVLKGWASAKRRVSGGVLLALLLTLTLSGYLLYYAGNDDLRAAIALAHWIPGLLAPALYIVHRIKAANARKALQSTAHPRESRGPGFLRRRGAALSDIQQTSLDPRFRGEERR
jgi:hypothetical protein